MPPMLIFPRFLVLGLRWVRQYLLRLETVVSLFVVWLLWMYFRWLNAKYRSDSESLAGAFTSSLPFSVGLTNLKPSKAGHLWSYSDADVGFYAAQGVRESMEDRMSVFKADYSQNRISMYGIFDGHGGKFVSDFVEKFFFQSVFQRVQDVNNLQEKLNMTKILTEEVLRLDAQILAAAGSAQDLTGSTLLAAFVHSDGRYLSVANVGDSRAAICDQDGRAHSLTVDHKPDSEKEKRRIEASGGVVAFLGVWRVMGILATSRALGDAQLKRIGVLTAEPDIQTLDLWAVKPRFVILASDGLWDVVKVDEAVEVVKKHLHNRDQAFGARPLVHLALKRLSMDNVSVMVILLSKSS